MTKQIFLITLALLLVLTAIGCGTGTSVMNSSTNTGTNRSTYAPVPTTTHVHSFGAWQTVAHPTCTTGGREKRTCSCGEAEYRDTAALSHNFGSWQTVTTATCSDEGEQKRTCSRCGLAETQTIAKTDHAFNLIGVCTVCGKNVIKDKLIANGPITVTHYDSPFSNTTTLSYNQKTGKFKIENTTSGYVGGALSEGTYSYEFIWGNFYNGSGGYVDKLNTFSTFGEITSATSFTVSSTNSKTYSLRVENSSMFSLVQSIFKASTTAINAKLFQDYGYVLDT